MLMEIKARKLSDEKYDTTKDAIALFTEFSKEMTWLPYGISMTEGMTRDELISILEKNGYSADGTTSKHYEDEGDRISVPFPCKNLSLKGTRRKAEAIMKIDTSTREISSIDYYFGDTLTDEEVEIFFGNTKLLKTPEDFTTEVKEQLLEDAKQYFLNNDICTNFYEDPVTFQDMEFYKGCVISQNFRDDLDDIGITLIIYKATTTSGDTVYCGSTYNRLTINENDELDMHDIGYTEYYYDPEEIREHNRYYFIFSDDELFETIN